MRNLTRLRLRDHITDKELLAERQSLDLEQVRLSQATENARRLETWFEPARMLVQFSNDVTSAFEAATLEQRRSLLQVVGSNPTLRDKQLSIHAKKPFRKWNGFSTCPEWRWLGEVRTFVRNPENMESKLDLKTLRGVSS